MLLQLTGYSGIAGSCEFGGCTGEFGWTSLCKAESYLKKLVTSEWEM